MGRRITGGLAIYGAIVLALQATGAVTGYFTNRRILGDVLVDGRAAAGVPVFLDDGSGNIRRAFTDGDGRFRFPIASSRLRRARLLLCPAGANPMASDEQPVNLLGRQSFGFSTKQLRVKVPLWVFGWRAEVPPECDGTAPAPA